MGGGRISRGQTIGGMPSADHYSQEDANVAEGGEIGSDGKAFFFFGTLMLPPVLTRVIGHPGSSLTFYDGYLRGYVRHAVQGADYPAIVKEAESEQWIGRPLADDEKGVRGTYVTGLTEEDARALDVFEGDEYTRMSLPIDILSAAERIDSLSQTMLVPTTRDAVSKKTVLQVRKAEVYVWTDGAHRLEKNTWDFNSFLANKSARWTGIKPEVEQDQAEFADVDRYRALGGRIFPDQKYKYGKELLKYWRFDERYVNLNHGSYGSPPVPVVEAMHKISETCEKNPDLFMRRTYQPLLKDVRRQLAEIVHADVDDVVLTTNATTSLNTITWNIDWKAGDVIVAYSTTYNAVKQTLKQLCDKYDGVTYVEVPVTFPMYHDDIVSRTEQTLKECNAKRGQKVRLVCVDAIASNPGVVYPWERIVKLCKKYDALSLVDAAHELGQMPVDLKRAQPDFWLSNAHKWLMCHRGVSILYVAKHLQKQIRTSIPTSHAYESSKYPSPDGRPWVWAEQWTWTGTVDFAPFLAVSSAIEFRKFLGGEDRIRAYTSKLAKEGGRIAADIFGTDVMENDKHELTASMVNVRLPISPMSTDFAELTAQLNYLTDAQFERQVFGAPYLHDGHWWVRMSAQVWNELSDFEIVANVLKEICEKINDGSWKSKK